MTHWIPLALLLPTLGACAAPHSAPLDDGRAKTEVYVLGMIHSGHRTSETWGLDEVRATLRTIAPDVICCEIPPANWPGTLETWRARHVVEDSRVKVFPEYTDVLLPLTDELDFVVEPCAGWTSEMASARRERMQRLEESDEDADARAAYARDEAWAEAWLAANPAPAAEDDPFYIHSPRYDLRTKVELGAYEYHLGPLIPDPGGWTAINEAHFALIADAIERHRGERIAITFGAGHKYWFLERLRELPGVELMDVRDVLPEPPMRTDDEAVAEELLNLFDSLCAVWATDRGSSGMPLARVQESLAPKDNAAFLAALEASADSETSEFADGPFLGPVQAEPVGAEGAWSLRALVRRLGDAEPEAGAGDAGWLTATLEPDPTRPGGFAWTRLELPAWLLAQRPEVSE